MRDYVYIGPRLELIRVRLAWCWYLLREASIYIRPIKQLLRLRELRLRLAHVQRCQNFGWSPCPFNSTIRAHKRLTSQCHGSLVTAIAGIIG